MKSYIHLLTIPPPPQPPIKPDKIMRDINLIVVHCSATREDSQFSPEDLHRLHVEQNGWSDIGYHFYYTRDGREHVCRPITRPGAHARGHNKYSVGLSYEGGLNAMGFPADTRTKRQKQAIANRIETLRKEYGPIPAIGHRDLSPDKNGDGTIEANERLKECPCYDTTTEYNTVETLRPFLIHYYNGIHR